MRLDRFVALLILASCSRGSPPSEGESGTPSPGVLNPSAGRAEGESRSEEPWGWGPTALRGVAHGDHTPRHDGLVLMHGDLHFEVVLDRGGRHRVYLTDAVRNELPAAAASSVRVTILRSERDAPEGLELEIDEFGESWVASGRPVVEPESRALISLVHDGRPYEIELPFFAPSVPDPHRTH